MYKNPHWYILGLFGCPNPSVKTSDFGFGFNNLIQEFDIRPFLWMMVEPI
jgi:hypothetical protein